MGKRERLLIGEVGTIDELSWELGRVERGQMGSVRAMCLDVRKMKGIVIESTSCKWYGLQGMANVIYMSLDYGQWELWYSCDI